MTKKEVLEKTALEHAKFLESKTAEYKPKTTKIKAIQYDGSYEMAKAIEANCKCTIVTEIGGFTLMGVSITKDYIRAFIGDYFINQGGWYRFMLKEEFESKYEI